MEIRKGYMVLEVGYEYNDEFYHTSNHGEMYEAPDKVFIDKIKAVEELEKKSLNKLRGLALSSYGECMDEIYKKGKREAFETICQELEVNIEEGEDVPEDATDEQLHRLLDCIKMEFFKLVEVNLE